MEFIDELAAARLDVSRGRDALEAEHAELSTERSVLEEEAWQ